MPDAHALMLYIDNDAQLYQGPRKAIVDGLLKKKNAGTYSFEKSKKAWEHLVEAGAKKYAREHAGPMGPTAWYQLFDPGVRRDTAAMLAREFEDEWKLGNYSTQQEKLMTAAQRAARGKSDSKAIEAFSQGARDAGFAKQVSLRGMSALSGPFKVTGSTDKSIYFTDGSGEQYFFSHNGNEAQKTGFYKRAKIKVQVVRGPGDLTGAPGWKKKAPKKRAKKLPKFKLTDKIAAVLSAASVGGGDSLTPGFEDAKDAGLIHGTSGGGLRFTPEGEAYFKKNRDKVQKAKDRYFRGGKKKATKKKATKKKAAAKRTTTKLDKEIRRALRGSAYTADDVFITSKSAPYPVGTVLTVTDDSGYHDMMVVVAFPKVVQVGQDSVVVRYDKYSRSHEPKRVPMSDIGSEFMPLRTIRAGHKVSPDYIPEHLYPTIKAVGGKPPKGVVVQAIKPKKNAWVERYMKKYVLVVANNSVAAFTDRQEAVDLAEALNEMTLAQAKKEVGL